MGLHPQYRDINGRRYTLLYVRGPDRDAAVDGSRPITVNLRGIEDKGNTCGALITSLPKQYRHALQNWLVGDYHRGDWLGSPTFPDDTSLKQIDDASFDAADAVAARRVVGGYEGAVHFGLDGERLSLRDAVQRLNVCCDVNSGFNLKTQFFVSMLDDDLGQLTSATTVTQTRDILRDSFSVEPRVEDFFNQIPFEYGHEPAKASAGRTADQSADQWRAAGTMTDTASVTATLETRAAPTRQLWYVYSSLVAADIISRVLARAVSVPTRVIWRQGLAGLNFDLAAIVKVTHVDGIGTNGYEDHPVRVMRQDYDPQDYSVTLEGDDLGYLFAPRDKTGTQVGQMSDHSRVAQSVALVVMRARRWRAVDAAVGMTPAAVLG